MSSSTPLRISLINSALFWSRGPIQRRICWWWWFTTSATTPASKSGCAGKSTRSSKPMMITPSKTWKNSNTSTGFSSKPRAIMDLEHYYLWERLSNRIIFSIYRFWRECQSQFSWQEYTTMKNTLKIPTNFGQKDGKINVITCILLYYWDLEEAHELVLVSIWPSLNQK